MTTCDFQPFPLGLDFPGQGVGLILAGGVPRGLCECVHLLFLPGMFSGSAAATSAGPVSALCPWAHSKCRDMSAGPNVMMVRRAGNSPLKEWEVGSLPPPGTIASCQLPQTRQGCHGASCKSISIDRLVPSWCSRVPSFPFSSHLTREKKRGCAWPTRPGGDGPPRSLKLWMAAVLY